MDNAEVTMDEFVALKPRAGDFIARFGEPFIDFETRGDLVLVGDSTSGENIAKVYKASRKDDAGKITLTMPGEMRGLIVEVEDGECLDEFSGETSQRKALLLRNGQNFRIMGCAYPAG